MDMSLSTAAILGFVLLLIVVAGVFVGMRVVGKRVQDRKDHPS